MHGPHCCTIERLHLDRVLEFAAFRWPSSGFSADEWPTGSGSVQHDTALRPRLLHFAPGRWLAPAPTPATEALLAAAARDGSGSCVDVTGKWRQLHVAGPGASRLLACTLDIASTLEGRGCAAAVLFDCPAIVASAAGGFELWVQSSYCADFLATAGRFAVELGRER